MNIVRIFLLSSDTANTHTSLIHHRDRSPLVCLERSLM
jgi:hypothetical protein